MAFLWPPGVKIRPVLTIHQEKLNCYLHDQQSRQRRQLQCPTSLVSKESYAFSMATIKFSTFSDFSLTSCAQGAASRFKQLSYDPSFDMAEKRKKPSHSVFLKKLVRSRFVSFRFMSSILLFIQLYIEDSYPFPFLGIFSFFFVQTILETLFLHYIKQQARSEKLSLPLTSLS